MQLIAKESRFAVYNDCLSGAGHQDAWINVQNETYAPVPLGMGPYRMDDGAALRCDRSYLWMTAEYEPLPPKAEWADRVTDNISSYSELFEAAFAIAQSHPELVGQLGKDWVAILVTPHLYRRGDSISWHSDGMSYSGAFAYYAHNQWNCLWGGELLFVDDTTELSSSPDARRCRLDNDSENARLMNPGMGQFVMPVPNRIVVIKGGCDHMLSKVHLAAGNNVRAVLAGFFVRPNAVARLLTGGTKGIATRR